ncbi:MAG: hypothetical protein AAF370_03330 [Pseudomonadota bacterium]
MTSRHAIVTSTAASSRGVFLDIFKLPFILLLILGHCDVSAALGQHLHGAEDDLANIDSELTS